MVIADACTLCSFSSFLNNTIPFFASATEQDFVAVSICKIIAKVSSIYGTGSWPCFPQGLHLAILCKVSHPPFKAPCFFIANMPYSLQVGVNLHDAPNKGDKRY